MNDNQTEGWSDLIRNLPRRSLPKSEPAQTVKHTCKESPKQHCKACTTERHESFKTYEILSKLNEADLDFLLKGAGEEVSGDKSRKITALAIVIYHKAISQLE